MESTMNEAKIGIIVNNKAPSIQQLILYRIDASILYLHY